MFNFRSIEKLIGEDPNTRLPNQLLHRMLFKYHSKLGHTYVPNQFARSTLSDNPFFVTTNSLGFRSDFDFLKQKSKSKRVVFLGDSQTAGDASLSNDKRFSDLLSNKFGDVEFLNFAVGGFGIDQQILAYEEYVDAFNPDIIVLSFSLLEDITRNVYRDAVVDINGKITHLSKPYFDLEEGKLILRNVPVKNDLVYVSPKGKSGKFKDELSSLMKYSVMYSNLPLYIKSQIQSFRKRKLNKIYSNPQNPKTKHFIALIERLIEKINGKTLILCPLPDPRGGNPNISPILNQLASNYHNVYHFDLNKYYDNLSTKSCWSLYTKSTRHYNELGHKLISKIISNELIKHNILSLKSLKKGESNNPQKVIPRESSSKYIMGISALYHDSACTLIKDGKIVAAVQEERFTRVKNDSSFPINAVNYCLEEAKIKISEIDSMIFYDNQIKTLERLVSSHLSAYPKGKNLWNSFIPKWLTTKLRIPNMIRETLGYKGKLFFANHHMSHAASAFFPSPYRKAAILTIDGVGEWATACIGKGHGNKIELIKQLNYPHSLGLLYSAFTYYTGFRVNRGEYKLMGLAPYGKPKYVDLIKDNLISINPDGSILLNMNYFGFLDTKVMTNDNFSELFGSEPRVQESEITQMECDIAKSIQVVTEEIVLLMAKHAYEITGCKNICLAGGVALNCVSNGRLLREGNFDDVWIQPASGDAGGSLGCAFFANASLYPSNFDRKEERNIQKGSYWGPSYSNEEIEAALTSYNFKFNKYKSEERTKLIAKYLSEEKVVGHFSGRMEFGPRALGARSILGDPRSETTQSKLNLKIKYRESFRPFAPTVLEQDINEYFELEKPSPFMLLVASVQKNRCLSMPETLEKDLISKVNLKRSDIPAVTHVDYSARVQSVSESSHRDYFKLIETFKELTSYGVVVNTSFNVRGEPIICTPLNALNCFMKTEMDVLSIGDYILLKEAQNNHHIFSKEEHKNKETPPESKKGQSEINDFSSKLFTNYISNLSGKISNANFEIENNIASNTNWNNYLEEAELLEHIDSLSTEEEIDMMLKNWTGFSKDEKKLLYPLVKELIIKKRSITSVDIFYESDLEEDIYAMF